MHAMTMVLLHVMLKVFSVAVGIRTNISLNLFVDVYGRDSKRFAPSG